eukprot:13003318-Alexandrium_andersonii.AAC.1
MLVGSVVLIPYRVLQMASRHRNGHSTRAAGLSEQQRPHWQLGRPFGIILTLPPSVTRSRRER